MTSGDSGGTDEGRESGVEASGDSGLTGGSSEGEAIVIRRRVTRSLILEYHPFGKRHCSLLECLLGKKNDEEKTRYINQSMKLVYQDRAPTVHSWTRLY